MTDKKVFSVLAIGITDGERNVLRNIFRLSKHRVRTYELIEDQGITPDIGLLDPGDNAEAVAVASLHLKHPKLPTATVSNEAADETTPYRLRRPFVATRVLSVLDQIAIKELRYAPELVIGSKAGAGANEPAQIVNQAVDDTADNQSFHHRALVVDDSLPVRKQIEIELKLLGVAADFAETGEAAFTMLDSNTYDIIFLDVVLPGVDGYKICKTIKKNKVKKATPVIMLTSKSSPFDRIRGTFAGCNTYLTKPVSHDSFQKVVKHYLKI